MEWRSGGRKDLGVRESQCRVREPQDQPQVQYVTRTPGPSHSQLWFVPAQGYSKTQPVEGTESRSPRVKPPFSYGSTQLTAHVSYNVEIR